MRALRPMTQEEREFAEQKHDLVVEFLRRRHLPMNDYYDIVIFGYLSAVQQYFRDPPIGVELKDSILRGREYNSRAKRCGVTVSLDDADNPVTASNPAQDTERQIEGKSLLEQAASVATPKEAKIIGFLLDGFALHEAARLLKMPRAAAESCMESFCFRARTAIG